MAFRVRQDHPPIPQDVIDLILNEVCDDTPTLMTCSLVSPAFLATSRKYIFSAITFSLAKTDRYHLFHALCVGSPSLPEYVQELHLHGWFLYYMPLAQINRPDFCVPAIITTIVKSLRNLRLLDLTSGSSIEWDILGAQRQAAFLELIESAPLRSITIKCISWPLSSFVGCTQLRELTVTHPKSDCDVRHTADLALRAARLTAIDLGTDLGALRTSFGTSYPSLQSVNLSCTSLSDVVTCQEILRSAAQTLETLTLRMEAASLYEPFLTMLPALRRLSVDFAPGPGVGALQWVVEFIASLSAGGLEDLAISVHGDLQTYRDTIWSQLRTLITHEPTFPCLHHVKVGVNLLHATNPDVWFQEEEWEAVGLVERQLVSSSRITFEFTAPVIELEAYLAQQVMEDDYNEQLKSSGHGTLPVYLPMT